MRKEIDVGDALVYDCPFCGGRSITRYDGQWFFVTCDRCRAQTEQHISASQAIAFWNQRRGDLESQVVSRPEAEIAAALNNIAEALRDFHGAVVVMGELGVTLDE